MVLSAHWWGNKKCSKKLLKGDEQTEKYIALDETDDADRVLLWENNLQFKKNEKIAINDFAKPDISQYPDKIILLGLWRFPALHSNSKMWVSRLLISGNMKTRILWSYMCVSESLLKVQDSFAENKNWTNWWEVKSLMWKWIETKALILGRTST